MTTISTWWLDADKRKATLMWSSKTVNWEAIIPQPNPLSYHQLKNDCPWRMKWSCLRSSRWLDSAAKEEVLLFLHRALIYCTAQCWPVTHSDNTDKEPTQISGKWRSQAGVSVELEQLLQSLGHRQPGPEGNILPWHILRGTVHGDFFPSTSSAQDVWLLGSHCWEHSCRGLTTWHPLRKLKTQTLDFQFHLKFGTLDEGSV